MKHLLVLAIFLTLTSVIFSATISERNLLNFQNMLKAVTGRNAWDYNNYGNWCGRGGSNEPVDDIDSCCRDHDMCYYAVNRGECSGMFKLGVYMIPYNWKFENGIVTCSNDYSICAQTVCLCDSTCAQCFARSEYNEKHKRKGWISWNK